MILQFFSKVKKEDGRVETVERIMSGVADVTIEPKEIIVAHYDNGIRFNTTYQKDHDQIYQVWLLNDQFKTLKKLI